MWSNLSYNTTNESFSQLANFTVTQKPLSVEEIGGVLYFIVNISDYLPYVLLSSLGVIVGIFGNKCAILI